MSNPFATGALLYVNTVAARTLRAEQHAVETQAYAILPELMGI
jgi:hypothetical protein